MSAREVWAMRATWAQRRRLALELTEDKIHLVWLGGAVCGLAPTDAELTELASLVTCPGCKTMSVYAAATVAEASREISIILTERFSVMFAALGRAFGAGGPPRKR